jgi:hypothetical protein
MRRSPLAASVRVIVVRRAFVTGVVVVVRVRTGMQLAGAVAVFAFLCAMTVVMRVGMGMIMGVRVLVRMRVEQVAVPVPVLVRVRVFVRMLMQVIVGVAGGAGGFVVRHGELRERSGRRKLTEPARGPQAVLTRRARRVMPASAGVARERATGRCHASGRR